MSTIGGDGVTEFRESYPGIGRLLRSPMLAAGVGEFAKKIMNNAKENSPVGDPATDPGSGTFKESWEIQQVARTGRHHDRTGFIVRNTDPGGFYIEKGTSTTPGHNTLMNAIESMKQEGSE